MQRTIAAVAAVVTALIAVSSAEAHTPIWQAGPIDSISHALEYPNAVYTYVAYRDLTRPGQVDYFSVAAWQGTDLNPEIDVAAWPTLTHFNPSLAIIGPGLPAPTGPVSFTVPRGDGAVVLTYIGPWPPVEWYEPFGGTLLYYDVRQHFTVPATGTYYLAVFASTVNTPQAGPYALSIGTIEHVEVKPHTRCLVQAWYHGRPWQTCFASGTQGSSSGIVSR